jgi:hypothetical protein
MLLKTIPEVRFLTGTFMKINFTLLAKKIIALAKSFSVPVPATETNSCYPELAEGITINIKKQYHNDPLTAGSFSFLFGGLSDLLLKTKRRTQNLKLKTYNSELLTHN